MKSYTLESVITSYSIHYTKLYDMEVEKHARYSIFNFGYWRNVLASKMLYKNAFSQLEKLAD